MDVQQKIAGFRERLVERPESRVFAPLAELLHETGQTEEALTLLAEGIRRHPDYVSAQVVEARLMMAVGRRQEAVTTLRAVLQRDGQNVVALTMLVDDCLASAQTAEATELVRKLVTLDPDQQRWPQELARLEKSGKVSAPGRDGFATMTLVDIYLQQGYRRRALAALYAILARDPDQRDVQAKIAQLEAALSTDGDEQKTDPGQEPDKTRPATPDTAAAGPSPGTNAQLKAKQRTQEKERFARWLDSFDTERGESS